MSLPKERRINRHLFPTSRPNRFCRGKFSTLAIYSYAGQSRFSFSISKKISKSAVVRNRLRRFGYRSIGEVLATIKSGLLLKFSIHEITKSYDDFKLDVVNLLKESDILNKQ